MAIMKIVIFCGGKGTRLGEVTNSLIPKPLVTVGSKPIVLHIMEHYSRYGFKEFILATGYLSWEIKKFFSNLKEFYSDYTINLNNNDIKYHRNSIPLDWRITILNTGEESGTAGRLKKVYPYLSDGPFMATYGDGVSDVNLDNLRQFHEDHKKLVTVTGVVQPGRFGEITLDGSSIRDWSEKPTDHNKFINGGFMVIDKKFIEKFILACDDSEMLERGPLSSAALKNEVMLYKHSGFWQCMDTPRDWETLNNYFFANEEMW
jgi:glucose-1-phosphate cytidylyltransferase